MLATLLAPIRLRGRRSFQQPHPSPFMPYEPLSDTSALHDGEPCPAECLHPWVYAYDRDRACWHVVRACGCARVYLTCGRGRNPTREDVRAKAEVLNRIYGLQQ